MYVQLAIWAVHQYIAALHYVHGSHSCIIVPGQAFSHSQCSVRAGAIGVARAAMAVPLFGPISGNTFKPRYVRTPYSSIPVVSAVIALHGSVIDSWIVARLLIKICNLEVKVSMLLSFNLQRALLCLSTLVPLPTSPMATPPSWQTRLP